MEGRNGAVCWFGLEMPVEGGEICIFLERAATREACARRSSEHAAEFTKLHGASSAREVEIIGGPASKIALPCICRHADCLPRPRVSRNERRRPYECLCKVAGREIAGEAPYAHFELLSTGIST